MTTCYNAVFIYFFKAEMIGQETKRTGLLNNITNIGILRLIVYYMESTQYLKFKKNTHCTCIFSPHRFVNAIFIHPNVNLTAYFIVSKHFAAKTGFPNSWFNNVTSGFSKCFILFQFG